mgnify:CR=1 FL=1
MLSAALALVAAAAMAAVLTAAGARVCAVSRLPLDRDLRLAVHFLLGAGVLALLLTAVGLAGVLTSWVAMGVLGAMAIAGRWRKWRRPGWARLLLAAAPLVVLLPVALAPPFFYDALVYHLGLPWQTLLEHGLRPHPENVYTTTPPLAQLVALPALAAGLERVPALLHMASFLAGGWAVTALASALGAPRWAAAMASACLPLLPLLVVMPAFPAAEGWGIAGIAAAAAIAVRHRLRAGGGVLVGALAGLAAAARAQVVPLAAALVLLTVVRQRTWGRRLGTAVSLLVAAAPWWLKNLVLLHAPLAPLGWSAGGQEALWRDGHATLAMASTVAQACRMVWASVWPQVWYLPALLLSSALLLLRGGGNRQRWLLGVVTVGLVAWAGLAAVPRYLGAVVALELALAASLAGLRAGRFAFAAVVGATVVAGAFGSIRLVARLGGVGLAVEEPAAVRARLVVNDPFPAFAAAAGLPQEARVVFVGEPRSFRFPRRFVAPSYYDTSPLAEVAEHASNDSDLANWLISEGFTHLLINWPELSRLGPGYPVAPWRSERGRHLFFALRARLAPPVLALSGVEIYALRGADRGGARLRNRASD